MRRGTTPTNTFTTDIDLTQAVVLYITYKQNHRVVIEKTLNDVTVTPEAIEVTLTQAETLKLHVGDVEMQIRARFPDGSAPASQVMVAPVEVILKEGVI